MARGEARAEGGAVTGPAWIFAYGSLMWDPGFVPAERVRARLEGFRRSFCMWSIRWRGTEAAPGLVLALDREEGAGCEGMALRPRAEEAGRVLAELRARELVSDAYEERVLPLSLADGREVEAVAYVIRRGHPQHACLGPEDQARIIARAEGLRGRNLDYLLNTVAHLEAEGIEEPELSALARLARRT